ncbi:MAG: hypothetical protein B6U76_10980 [Desulfurococcales archaeon ex4484_217_2]|nr:MAG: hypothetical protein B6U76_10980 [Desulfurococcales archaeon ex4484_217_2]
MTEEILGKKPVRRGTPVGRSDEGYIISLDEDHAYTLNPAAFYIWLLCSGELTVNEIIDKVADATGIKREDLKEPVNFIIKELLRVKLIE